MNPRATALAVLLKSEASPRHLEALLDDELSAHAEAHPGARAAAFNLVYTVLRNRLLLDFILRPNIKRKLERLDAEVLWLLRLGAAELVLLKTPDHAAVHAVVELAKRGPAKKAAGLVNGVLRSVARQEGEYPLPAKRRGPARHLSVVYSHPIWLVEILLDRLGREQAEAWLAADQERPALALRVNRLRGDVRSMAERLAPAAGAVEPHPLSPHALVLPEYRGQAMSLEGFAEGLWTPQDPGSQAVAELLGARPGMRVLDLCAGAGGKSGALAEAMENRGELLAVDVSAGRLDALRANMKRLGVDMVRAMQADGAKLDGVGEFDRVLVDAPCSGLGTMGRRPDIRWRVGPGDAKRLSGLQAALLTNAARLVRPGGVVLYATCTITEAENQAVVEKFLAAHPDFHLQWPDGDDAVRSHLGPDGFWQTMPHADACDAFFAARFKRQTPVPGVA